MRKSTSRATFTETNVRIALLVISVIVNYDFKKSMMCVYSAPSTCCNFGTVYIWKVKLIYVLTIESAFSVIRMCQEVNEYGGICDDHFYLHYMTRE